MNSSATSPRARWCVRDAAPIGLVVLLTATLIASAVGLVAAAPAASSPQARRKPCSGCGEASRSGLARGGRLPDAAEEAAVRDLENRERWSVGDAQRAVGLLDRSSASRRAVEAEIARRLATPGSATEESGAWLRAYQRGAVP